MIAAGWSPSVRLFEAAATATPVISDGWPGLDQLFRAGEEIVIAAAPDEVLRILSGAGAERGAVAEAARRRVLGEHTSAHRAAQLERDLLAALPDRAGSNQEDAFPRKGLVQDQGIRAERPEEAR
jgi:spore maturation protein CgeB